METSQPDQSRPRLVVNLVSWGTRRWYSPKPEHDRLRSWLVDQGFDALVTKYSVRFKNTSGDTISLGNAGLVDATGTARSLLERLANENMADGIYIGNVKRLAFGAKS